MIPIKSKEEIDLLREAGGVLAVIVEEIKSCIKPGITSEFIDTKVEKFIAARRAKPAFKGYRGFPNCTCISINDQVVHGIPGKRVLTEGDVVSIDVGIILNGYFSDTAFTVGIGKISENLKRLIQVTQGSLDKGIEQAVAGHHLSDISFAVQNYVESNNFSVVRDFVGHGIGKALHEEPEVPNFGLPHSGPVLKEGMVLAIEPMVNAGTWQTRILADGWTVVTQDGKPSAHFEHTVAITKKGPEILTK